MEENLLKTLIQIEDTINEAAKHYIQREQNVLIIYDRGAMDPVSCQSLIKYFQKLIYFNLKK